MDRPEPTIEELLSEPIIQAIMARDSVRADEVRRLMQQVRARMMHTRYPNRRMLAQGLERVPAYYQVPSPAALGAIEPRA
jgi:hypothetical protein